MTSLTGIAWEVVVDGIQIGLCAAILACLIWTKLKNRRAPAAAGDRGTLPVFTREMLLEVVNQNVSQALDTIVQAVETERQRLQQVCETREATAPPRKTTHRSPGEIFVSAPPRCDILPGRGTAAGRYEGVRQLSAGGLSPRQIADQLKLPVGEVELVVKLQAAPAIAGD